MGYKILTQGFLDGACYMYSIMNAYKTLTYPQMDNDDFVYMKPDTKCGKQKWENLIRVSPGTIDMLAGVGIFYYFTQLKILDTVEALEKQCNHFVRLAFDLLSDGDHAFEVANISLKAIDSFDFNDSVIILPVIKDVMFLAGNKIGNHWICINGRTDDNLHVVCSYSMQLPGRKYVEKLDYKHCRFYNNMVRIEDINEDTLEPVVNCIYRITKTR